MPIQLQRAILKVLDAWGGEAYCDSVIDALMNGTGEFRLVLTDEEKAQRDSSGNEFRHHCHAARQQLVKEGYIEEPKPDKRGIWTRTQKPYIPTDKVCNLCIRLNKGGWGS